MAVQPEAILKWLQEEMGYRPSGPSRAGPGGSVPSVDTIEKVCRGNMIPVWSFLLQRVKSEKTVTKIRRNILVHGGGDDAGKGRRGEREKGNSGGGGSSREMALQERELAQKEVERLRQILRRQRKELKAKMAEVTKEETERKRMLDDRSNLRHKQVMLESYDQQCDEAAKIFAEYHKRLRYYVNQARSSQRSSIDSSTEVASSLHASSEKEAVYSTIKGAKVTEDVILIETTRERNIRKACEFLAVQTIDRIRNSFPAFEGSGIHSNPQLEAAKLGYDFDGEIPEDVKNVVESCLRSPPLLLQAITAYTQRLKSLIIREIEKVDVRADAEALRYKYENNRVLDASSPDVTSPLQYQLYGNGKIGADLPSKGSENQLLERQKAHVEQFVATEDALNRAAEARSMSQKLLKRLHGSGDVVKSQPLIGGTSQNVGSLRQFQMEVWAKEREAAGVRASLSTLTSEVQRLNSLCAERKEAEDSLKKKWKKIEEFDSRRSELESIYTALLDANKAAAAFWSQQPLVAREYASSTIIPACTIVAELSNAAMDLIEKEVSSFLKSPDNSLYMLPSSPQALLEAMGTSGSAGLEAFAAAEKNASLLTARAGARDPSAIPSICRISAALQYPSGSDDGLASVLKAMEFCLKLRGSEACVLEDLAKAINLVHIRRDLVESGRTLLNHAHHAQQEYERTTNYCLTLASEQERTVGENWVPELKNAIKSAESSLDNCKNVRGLLDEWWEQPASTVVDWVTVDGENVVAWINHVRQLLAFYGNDIL